MATPSKSTWLLTAVIILAAINVVTLGFLWFGRRNPPPRHDARNFIISELQLNATQVHQFDSLRKIHFATVDALRDEVHQLKDQFFSRLPQRSSTVLQLADSIGNAQTKIEISTFEHFQALRDLCTPQQQQKFDRIIQEVLRTMGPGPGEGPPPPRRD
jgi:hypothetical protein